MPQNWVYRRLTKRNKKKKLIVIYLIKEWQSFCTTILIGNHHLSLINFKVQQFGTSIKLRIKPDDWIKPNIEKIGLSVKKVKITNEIRS